MNKTILFYTIIAVNLFFTLPLYAADQGAQKEAAKLLEVIDAKATMNKSVEEAMNQQIRQNPLMLPYADVLEQFFNKYMNYDSLKPELIKIYSATFTEQELKDLNAFYQSPTGRKALKAMPQVMAQSMQLGVARIQEHKEELQKMLKERAASFQQQEQKAKKAKP